MVLKIIILIFCERICDFAMNRFFVTDFIYRLYPLVANPTSDKDPFKVFSSDDIVLWQISS